MERIEPDKVQKTYVQLDGGQYFEVTVDGDDLEYWVVDSAEPPKMTHPKSDSFSTDFTFDLLPPRLRFYGTYEPELVPPDPYLLEELEDAAVDAPPVNDLKDSVFKARLQSTMTDNKYDRRVPNRKRGKLDMKRLWKAKTGSTSLFTQKEARKGKEYNIMLVVDESGSMNGEKMVQAAETALFLAKNFEAMNINLAILGFNHKLVLHKDFTKAIDDYAVVNAQMISRAQSGDGTCNHDYDALQRGYALLSRQKSEHSKNILILISDGKPEHCTEDISKMRQPSTLSSLEKQDKQHLHALVHKYSDDISSFAIGIFTDSWQVPDHIRANDLAQLKPLILNILRKKIQRG